MESRAWARAATTAGWVMTMAVSLAACEGDGGKSGGTAAASASAPPSTPSAAAPPAPPPATPRPPAITVDDRGATIDGVSFAGAPAEWRDNAAAALAGHPLVAGETVRVNVMRDSKTPKVLAMVSALGSAKARHASVRTPTRDRTSAELDLALPASRTGEAPGCSVVAMIEANGAVAVWSKAGGVAARFARGMAGPDLSTSTEALRKKAAACDSPVWFVGAAEGVTWGLTFDLALRAIGGGEAGAPLKATQTVLLTQPPVPGRAVKEE